MAEYIDREALLELINEDCKYQNPTNEYTRGCNEVCDWAIKTIENMPTADVVPKSEVDKMENAYYRATRKANKNAITAIQNAKQEVAREILSDLKKQIHDKAIYPGAKDTYSFVNVKVFDAVLNNVLKK